MQRLILWVPSPQRRKRCMQLLSYSINVTVTVVVSLNLVDFSQDASTLYTSLTSNLQQSVQSGTFTQYVEQVATVFGSTALTSVSTTIV